MKIYSSRQIQEVIDLKLDLPELIASQRRAFIDFSNGLINVPTPLQMHFPKEGGDCHVKTGFKEDDDIFIVKVATGFYKSSTHDGAILVFSSKTGILESTLLDNSFLTTLRTSLAACVASQVTPWKIEHIGIAGTGQLGLLVLEIMKLLYPSSTFSIWGRSRDKVIKAIERYEDVELCSSIDDLLARGDLIITTTASTKPIIKMVSNTKTHIIALGADDDSKSECSPRLFAMADKIIVDSSTQATKFGDVSRAIKAESIAPKALEELGKVVQNRISTRASLVITDLTGIAAQDIEITRFVLSKLNKR